MSAQLPSGIGTLAAMYLTMSTSRVLWVACSAGMLWGCGQPLVELSDKLAEGTDRCAGQPTTHFAIRVNMDPRRTEVPPWDAADPNASSHFSHNAYVFTARGEAREVNFYYMPTGERVWQWHVLDDGAAEIGSGELGFDCNGVLERSELLTPLQLLASDGTLGAPITVSYEASTATLPYYTIDSITQDGHEAAECP